MAEQNETSMEDILASIQSILSDDEEVTPVAESEPEKQPEPDPEPAEDVAPAEDDAAAGSSAPVAEEDDPDDVMKLTPDMIVGETGDSPAPVVEKPADDIGRLREVMASTPEEREDDDFVPEPVISDDPLPEQDDALVERMHRTVMADEDVLMSEPSVDAAALSLKSLREFADDKKAEIGNGCLTIESIVRESVKPYLKEWLDVNLPAIVERIVKKEVAHIMDRLDLK